MEFKKDSFSSEEREIDKKEILELEIDHVAKGLEKAQLENEAFNFNLKKKHRVLENLQRKVEQRIFLTNKGWQGVVWFFESEAKQLKSYNSTLKNELPIHYAYTDTPQPKNVEKGYKSNSFKPTGDYVQELPDFYEQIKQFDELYAAECKRRKEFEKILNKEILSKLQSNQKKGKQLAHKVSYDINLTRKKLLQFWSVQQAKMTSLETCITQRKPGKNDKDAFEHYLQLYNSRVVSHEELKKFCTSIIKNWREYTSFEIQRAKLLNELLPKFLTQQQKCFGRRPEKEKLAESLINLLPKQTIIDHCKILKMFNQEDMDDIQKFVGGNIKNYDSKSLEVFVKESIIKDMPKTPFAKWQCKVLCKIGKIMTSEKRCVFVYTCDDYVILYHVPPFNEDTGINAEIKILLNIKAEKIKWKQIGNDAVDLKYKQKGLVFQSTYHQQIKLQDKSYFKKFNESFTLNEKK